jgi:hypothetical protein
MVARISTFGNTMEGRAVSHKICQLYLVVAMTIYSRLSKKKSQLRDLVLRLCWLHEMAAPFLDCCISCGHVVGVAQLRQKDRRLRVQVRLRTRT